MHFSLHSFFIKNKVKTTDKEDSPVLQNIKSLPKFSDLLVFDEVLIYHHAQKYRVPLIIFDPQRGLYIFEKKQWKLEDLRHATIEKQKQVQPAQNTLSYSFLQDIIRQKYNELIHNDGVTLSNFLLLENLTSHEYEQLDEAIKEYLPREKIIFSDMQKADIFQKLQNGIQEAANLLDTHTTLGNLLIQYTLVDEEQLYFASDEQRNFLDAPLQKFHNLTGKSKSGTTNLILLKAITEVLQHPEKKVVILKPTTLSKDILQHKFLSIIEHAIVEIEFNSIEILTPIELVNRHLQKLKMKQLEEVLHIDEKLMKKSFDIADILICDDSYLMADFFIEYLKHIQNNKTLLFVNNNSYPSTFELKKSY